MGEYSAQRNRCQRCGSTEAWAHSHVPRELPTGRNHSSIQQADKQGDGKEANRQLDALESRIAAMREDYPDRDDAQYMQHTMAYLTGDPHSPDPEDHIKLDWKPVVFTKNEAGELNYPPMERKY